MRKTFLTKGFVRFSRGLAGAALIAAAIGITSCETHSNSDRNESIKVYADPIAKEPIDAGIVGVKGGLAKLYVDANIDFVATWEDDAATPWAKVVDYSSTDPQTGLRVITLKANRRSTTSSYYTRRTGMLILAASDGELNYNRIIPIHQGSTARVSNDFATLKYGKTDPRFTDGETPIDNWTTAQKNLGFTSTTIEGEEVAHCYGKNGYLKLGDDKGHGADLISPYTNTLRSDSLLMVSFRAVAFTDYMTGARDDNKITVEVLGGGVIRDFAQSEKTISSSSSPARKPTRLRPTRGSASSAAPSRRTPPSTTAFTSTISTSAVCRRSKRTTLPKTTAAVRTSSWERLSTRRNKSKKEEQVVSTKKSLK